MLKLRVEQMQVLAQVPQREYQKNMMLHAQKFFPEECTKIGALNLEKFIQDGIAKADGYGIDDRADVAKFLNLQFVFGPEFDHECAWASEVLGNVSITSGAAKVMLLNEAAMDELRQKKAK
jgi:hypothetical protein